MDRLPCFRQIVRQTAAFHLHQVQQLFAQVGIVGQKNGLALSVYASSSSSARHLSILCSMQSAVLGLNALVMVPACRSHNQSIHQSITPWSECPDSGACMLITQSIKPSVNQVINQPILRLNALIPVPACRSHNQSIIQAINQLLLGLNALIVVPACRSHNQSIHQSVK